MESVLLSLLYSVSLFVGSLALECPLGYEQFGASDEDISATAVTTDSSFTLISQCGDACSATANCVVFSWDESVCKLFDTDTSTTTTEATQILCTPLVCPAGSPQIGAINNAFSASGTLYTDKNTIEECQTTCDDTSWCNSFVWAPVQADSGPSSNECTLYTNMVPDTFVDGNQIICQDTCDLYDRGSADAYCWGDPHTYMWNGIWQHFQGEVSPAGYYSYYMVTACNQGLKQEEMPWSVVGIVYGNGNNVAWSVYMVLELYDDDDIYYVFIDSSYTRRGIVKVPFGTSRLWEDVTGLVNSGALTMSSLGTGNNVVVAGKFNLNIGTNWWHTLTVTDDDGNDCTVNFYFAGSTIKVSEPECYVCYACGLFGDFQAGAQGSASILNCHGQRVAVDSYWYPAGAWALDEDGLTWATGYTDEFCQAADVPTPPPVSPPALPDPPACTDEEMVDIQAQCQAARTAQAECCLFIAEGRSFCADLQADCEADACATDTATAVANFNSFVEEECSNPTGIFPKLLYEFEGDLKDTMSGGDSQYTLSTSGTVGLENGKLSCSGDGFVMSGDLDFGVASHSFEVLIQMRDGLDRSSKEGGSMMGIQNSAEDKDEMISFIAKSNRGDDAQYGVMSDFFADGSDQTYEKITDSAADGVDTEIIHIVVTFEETTGTDEIKYYRDGLVEELKDGLVTEATFVTTSGTFTLSVCNSYNTNNRDGFQAFDGDVLMAAYYTSALSSGDVTALYNSRMSNVLTGYEIMGNELMPGKTIRKNQVLFDVNNAYGLYMRGTPATLVLIKMADYSVLGEWGDGGDCSYLMYGETDGSLALYDSNGDVIETLIAGGAAGSGSVVLTTSGELRVTDGAGTSEVVSALAGVPNLDWWDAINPAAQGGSFEAMGSMWNFLTMVLVVLLVFNITCFAVLIFRKNAAKPRYKVVSIDSTDVDTDVEDAVQFIKNEKH